MGALWKKTNKNNKKYLSGYVEIDGKKHPVVIFSNEYKKEEKHPQFIVYQPF
jgi:uncharacterized protein (DUF736 family)